MAKRLRRAADAALIAAGRVALLPRLRKTPTPTPPPTPARARWGALSPPPPRQRAPEPRTAARIVEANREDEDDSDCSNQRQLGRPPLIHDHGEEAEAGGRAGADCCSRSRPRP